MGIISENYDLVYYHAEKLRFIGILAYPKTAARLEHVSFCTHENVNGFVWFVTAAMFLGSS